MDKCHSGLKLSPLHSCVEILALTPSLMDSAAPLCLMTTAAIQLRATWVRTWTWKGTLLQVRLPLWQGHFSVPPKRHHGSREECGVASRESVREECGMEGLMSCKLRRHAILTCTFCCILSQRCHRVLSAAVSPSGICRWTSYQTVPLICITCRCHPCPPPLKVCTLACILRGKSLLRNLCAKLGVGTHL